MAEPLDGATPHVVTVALPGAQRAAERAIELIDANARAVSIVGRDGSGKSSALSLLEQELRTRQWQVLRVGFPRLGDDAAVVAMLELGGQLPGSRQVLAELQRPELRWTDKQERLTNGLRSAASASRLAVLLDDPVSSGELDSVSTMFRARAASLCAALRNLPSVTIVQASRRSTGSDDITLEPGSIPSEVLRADNWTGSRAIAAQQLLSVPRLERYSPLELRLLVGLVDRGLDLDALHHGRWDPRSIVERLFDASVTTTLRSLLGKLALVRTPFDEALLARLGLDQHPVESVALLREALLIHEVEGSFRLHDLVAREARERQWLDASAEEAAHRELAAWHDESFVAASKGLTTRVALRHEVEVIHQLTEAGDAQSVLGRSVFFVEQLDALGKSLSQKRRFSEAVLVYERALAHDESDAYAHHYLAWNLDVEAREESRILMHYTMARGLQPGHVWYHGRRICFLITTGRLEDAQESWSDARTDLDLGDEDLLIPTELHRPVAQLLLHRGQLDFARRALDDIPPRSRSRLEWYASLEQLLAEQEEAELQHYVFPPSVPAKARWQGPHLLRDAGDIPRVRSWMPGRIASADERGIRIRVARNSDSEVSYGHRSLTHEELLARTHYTARGLRLPVGTFVELITLDDDTHGTREILLSWPREARHLEGLPEIMPRPDRFIRRVAAAV